ncbi:OLC1v1028553C1 [Oldenlandia corymbosa var. corymbosa]|uniref:Exocyst subunit Exo70 family protein n=1 Tax=Oldenlandia corymbosa var. corymbosa TaxID=529605 RepID=A0AAV1CEV2_OLDCO|nr:OLC1v1028553C1 [Oldenlandia corymbosa var. corymbosa]
MMQPTENKNGEIMNSASFSSPKSPIESVSSPDRLSRCTNTVNDRGTFPADQVSNDIDRITDALLNSNENAAAEVPSDTVEIFSKIIESRIASSRNQNPGSNNHKMTEEDSFFFEAVVRLSKLTNAFSELSSSSMSSAVITSDSLNRTSSVLQKAMAFLEEELRALLEDTQCRESNGNTNFCLIRESSDQSSPVAEMNDNSDLPGYPPDVVTKMGRIVSTMISGGYDKECFQVYSIARRTLFQEQLKKLEHEKLNMDDVWRMSWDSLEKEINRWVKMVKTCSETLFPAEKKLGEMVFSDHPMIFTPIFSNLARSVVIQLLDFAGAVAMTKRSAEKLFKFLDMYETLQDVIPAISTAGCTESENSEHELKSEISAACDRLGEAAMNIFLDLENSIKNDVAKTAVPGGAVHPLTRYVLNYLKYACEYKSTLEKIFQKSPDNLEQSESPDDHHPGDPNPKPFSDQIVKVMDLLDGNIEAKSMLYRDPSLRYVFLMNNGRYILQKVKGSAEIHQVMGDNWCRRRSTVVRQYHKNYQRETWVRLLHCLNHEGLMVNGKVNKPLLKERLKNFNTMFDEIVKTQNTWVVSDEQLQSELRVSISAVVIPAYRSFLGRFRQHLDSSKQADKYIKHQPEELEGHIDKLFEGVAISMARRRT